MKGSASLLLLLICLTYILALPSQLHYEVNDESQFTLESSLDARGHLSTNGQRTGGSYATLDSTLVTECVQEDSTSYYFVTNLFSTDVNAGQAGQANEEKISRRDNSMLEDDDDDDDSDALGYDMYYQQTFDGQITNVWYREDDSMFFVNIKLGAINALQTHIVPEGSSKSFMVQDPVGKHTSEFQGTAQTQILTITETFNQLDVQSFPDPNLSPDNVKIQAQTTTKISPYPNVAAGGYISVSNSIQMVDLVNIQKEKSGKAMKGMSDTTALDATLSSLGSLNITMSSFQKTLTSKFQRLQIKDLETSGYIKDSLFGIASKGIQIRPIEKMNNFRVVLESVLMSNWSNPTQDVKSMNKLIKYINGAPQEIQTIEEYMKRLNTLSVSSRKKLFYIVSGLNGMASIDMLIQQGILSKDSQIAIDSIIASNGIPSKNINDRLLLNLHNLAFNGAFTSINKAAALSLGSSLGRSTDSSLRNRYGVLLLNQLIQSLSISNSDWLVTVIHAMGNAGPSIPFESIPWNKLLMHGDSRVRLAAVGALRKFAHHRDVPTLLQKVLLTESDIRVRTTATNIGGKLLTIPEIQDSDFPFNKSWEGSFQFGGEEVNATFSGLLFAGTNFNCNQEYFNYEIQAKADANLVFFDWSKEAALAEILYGKANGQLIGNEIYLRVWDDVIYDQQFPVVDCSEHVYPLYHAEPGISVSYTLWVSVIPVTFTASASAVIDLDWGWQICDDKLSALVELIPEVTIVLDGDAEVFLLIAKAGIELDGSFNAQVRPQGYIAGSNCTVGFDVRFESNPAQFDLDSYYQFHECEYWIFDCSWGDKHTQTWYSWNSQSENKVIFDKSWKITP